MQIENPADSESLPLKRSRLDIRDFLAKGVLIDAKDSMNNWCVATVIELRPKEERLWVRYDGWAAKWNEVYINNDISLFFNASSRISPSIRKRSCPSEG